MSPSGLIGREEARVLELIELRFWFDAALRELVCTRAPTGDRQALCFKALRQVFIELTLSLGKQGGRKVKTHGPSSSWMQPQGLTLLWKDETAEMGIVLLSSPKKLFAWVSMRGCNGAKLVR